MFIYMCVYVFFRCTHILMERMDLERQKELDAYGRLCLIFYIRTGTFSYRVVGKNQTLYLLCNIHLLTNLNPPPQKQRDMR